MASAAWARATITSVLLGAILAVALLSLQGESPGAVLEESSTWDDFDQSELLEALSQVDGVTSPQATTTHATIAPPARQVERSQTAMQVSQTALSAKMAALKAAMAQQATARQQMLRDAQRAYRASRTSPVPQARPMAALQTYRPPLGDPAEAPRAVAAPVPTVAMLAQAHTSLSQSAANLAKASSQLDQWRPGDSTVASAVQREQLEAEHRRFVVERAKVAQVKQEAKKAIEAVKQHALREAKDLVVAERKRALKLASHAAEDVAHHLSMGGRVKGAELLESGGDGEVLHRSATEERALALAKAAMKQAVEAKAAQQKLRAQLQQARAEETRLRDEQKSQQARMTQLASEVQRSSSELKADLQQKASDALLPEKQHSMMLLTKASMRQQAAEKQAQLLQEQLRLERTRRIKAEQVASTTVQGQGPIQNVHSTSNSGSAELLSSAEKKVQDIPEQNVDTASLEGSRPKIAAAEAAVHAAKAAMAKAGALAHDAVASAALAKAEAK